MHLQSSCTGVTDTVTAQHQPRVKDVKVKETFQNIPGEVGPLGLYTASIALCGGPVDRLTPMGLGVQCPEPGPVYSPRTRAPGAPTSSLVPGAGAASLAQ